MSIITPVRRSSGGGSYGFNPTSRDILSHQTDRAGKSGLLASRGYMASYDTFDGGIFSGWLDHFHYARPTSPLSLDNRFTVGGSSHGLRLAPASRDIPAASANSGGAFKRHDRPTDLPMLVSFSGFFIIRGDGSLTSEDWPFDGWGVAFDTQRWDETTRDFPQVTYKTRPNKPDGTPQDPAWHARVVKADGSTESRVIPGTAGLGIGLNEMKGAYQYVRLTWQLDAGTGRGSYYELQVGTQVFDMRNFLKSGETAYDHILKDTTWDHFTGTLNTGLLISRATNRSVEMIANQLVLTYDDKAAA